MLETALFVAALLAIAAGAAVGLGAWRWARLTRRLRARLAAAREPVVSRPPCRDDLESLPLPVQRYLRKVLPAHQPMVALAHMQHRGSFDTGTARPRWRPVCSDQLVVTRRPGFDWNAKIALLPGVTVRVHDAYVAGEGLLHAALSGALTLACKRGTPELAVGELMRFLAEAAWYPTALLPGQGLQWEAGDTPRSARATLTDGTVVAALMFDFDAEDRIATVRTQARGRMVGRRVVPTPWQGRFWNYQQRSGMEVPLDGEVSWLLPEGERPYWRGHLTRIEYEFAR